MNYFDMIPIELTQYIFNFTTPYNGLIRLVCKIWSKFVNKINIQNCAYIAANKGQLNVLDYLLKNGCEFNELVGCEAILGNQFETLQWLLNKFSWDGLKLCSTAAKTGNLLILQFLHKNQIQWNHFVSIEAAKGGHLELLKWALENGCEYNLKTWFNAAKYGHLEVLKWAKLKDFTYISHFIIPVGAAQNGHLEVLKWTFENGYNLHYITGMAAVKYGHLEVLKWLHIKECEFNEKTFGSAIIGNHIEILKWFQENGYHIDKYLDSKDDYKIVRDICFKYSRVITNNNCFFNFGYY